ncbi:MAG: hypothetical protein JO297_13305 [Nitrososphaeraceae archaeon]|nr:hypothetical protein [Nitrososphaeraceae archaeon]
MAELGIVEYFGMAEAFGIIAILFVVFTVGNKCNLSVDIQKFFDLD